MTPQLNEEFLDTGVQGWHEAGKLNLGTTQIVSFYDDLTLSSTPNGIKNFLGNA